MFRSYTSRFKKPKSLNGGVSVLFAVDFRNRFLSLYREALGQMRCKYALNRHVYGLKERNYNILKQ